MELNEDNSDLRSDFKETTVLKSGKNDVKDELLVCNVTIGNLYDGEEAVGFDVSNGSEWIYPTNYPVRKYQKNIVSNALFKNTLVCLPTGLGKTFIAAVVMYNYHRWYPKHIIVFMAHSKPLVAQQVNACCNIMGISPSSIAELNGNMLHSNRKKQWESKKIFFLTPQVFNNDLARGNVKAENIRCLVVDEAHKALGNQAYCQVIRSLKPFNSNFRVLALSATPGDGMDTVKEVIQNLMISHLELHNEEDPDIKPYLHEKKIETVVVKLDNQILEIKDLFLKAVDKYVTPLVRYKILPQSFSSINPFSLVLKQRQFIQNPNVSTEIRGLMLSNFSVSISLFYALEELVTYGMRSFVTKLKCLQSSEGSTNKAHNRLANDCDIKSLIEHVDSILGPDHNVSFDVNSSLTKIFDEIDSIAPRPNIVYSHPKFVALEKVIQNHFESNNESTRVIVFCKSRQCTGEICNFLARFKPLVKPMIFIGQSQTSSGIVSKGFNQSAQLTVMKRFREGVYNTLIATCVAEEGLDIGEVDLIVNFDSGKNSNTQVQRSGRTGRKRDGRVVNLVTEGKEHQNYNISVSKGKKISKLLARDATKLPLYADNPRLIPKDINPVCQEMFLTSKRVVEEEPKAKKRKSKVDSNRKENKANKKMKDNTGNTENISPWTLIGGEKSNAGESQQKQNGAYRENRNCSNLEDHCAPADKTDASPCSIEIIDVEEKPTMLMYNDDVKASSDKHWETVLLDDSEEKSLIAEFLRTNNVALKPKNGFKELLNLKKFSQFLIHEKNETDLLDLSRKLKEVENYKLTQGSVECLKKELKIDNLISYLTESRNRIFNNVAKKLNKTDFKENKVQEDSKIVEDINPDDFLQPFESFWMPSKPNLLSSTPVRKFEERSAIKHIEHSPTSDINIHNWDESDFFTLKEKFSPRQETVEREPSVKKDLSMISITQALDIVDKANTKSFYNKDKIKEKPVEPSSPILFFSQKSRPTRNKFESNSPILTQKVANKGISRKCLDFKDNLENNTNVGKNSGGAKLENNEIWDSSDLFAETEVALKNQIQELEENLRAMENNLPKKDLCATPGNDSDSSAGTVNYDLNEINFNPNNNLHNLLKNDDCKENVNEFYKAKEINVNGVNMTRFLKGSIEKAEDGFDLCNSKFSEKTRSRPKMAVVRPLGFEDAPLRNLGKSVANESNLELIKNRKDDQSFKCDFSLFADEDFGDVPDSKSPVAEESSNSSDIFANKVALRREKSLSFSKNDIEKEVELFNNGDLSDGALEAIKAVEMFEKDENFTKKDAVDGSSSFRALDLDSDDSGDFFLPKKKPVKHLDELENDSIDKKPLQKKFNNKVSVQGFIDLEADISNHSKMSSDEENTSGLDDYDSSFVDEREICTQAPDVDMTAKYLQSTKSPIGIRPGMFKIPKKTVKEQLNVFSQMGSEGESEYENDSFVVSEEEISELNDISELELAEMELKYRKKRKRKDRSVKKKKRFKRVRRIESDSSEDEVVEIVQGQLNDTPNESEDIEELFKAPFVNESETSSSCIVSKGSGANAKPVIFVASRQIASAPEIATSLRAKWNVNIQVRSAPEADYIVSWRVGINRIQLSDFVNGSPSASNSLKESILKLSSNFQNYVLVVEDDKNKGLPKTSGCQKFMWAKHSSKRFIKILQNDVKVLFSRSKDDTARLLVLLYNEEKDKGENINLGKEISSEMERKMKFYATLPGINIANAFRISQKFSSISSFFKSCNTVFNIMKELGLKKENAVKVYQLMFVSPSI